MFMVVKGSDRLVGCVTTKQVKEIPRGEWGQMKVGEIATQCSDENTIGPQVDAMKALSIMSKTCMSGLRHDLHLYPQPPSPMQGVLAPGTRS
jgi:hypothetical protein